jgi:hypothetical protein
MTKHQETWETYVGAWRAHSPNEKQAALDSAVAEGCSYRDPLMETKGHAQLIRYMVDFHKQLPGGHFVTRYFLAHHDRSIAKWSMLDGQGTVIGEGISYGEYGADGKLVAMTGFFEAPSNAA